MAKQTFEDDNHEVAHYIILLGIYCGVATTGNDSVPWHTCTTWAKSVAIDVPLHINASIYKQFMTMVEQEETVLSAVEKCLRALLVKLCDLVGWEKDALIDLSGSAETDDWLEFSSNVIDCTPDYDQEGIMVPLLNVLVDLPSDLRTAVLVIPPAFEISTKLLPSLLNDAPALTQLCQRIQSIAITDSCFVTTKKLNVSKELFKAFYACSVLNEVSNLLESPFSDSNDSFMVFSDDVSLREFITVECEDLRDGFITEHDGIDSVKEWIKLRKLDNTRLTFGFLESDCTKEATGQFRASCRISSNVVNQNELDIPNCGVFGSLFESKCTHINFIIDVQAKSKADFPVILRKLQDTLRPGYFGK